jgi:hypothetical protein
VARLRLRRYGVATVSDVQPVPEVVERAFTWWSAKSAAGVYSRLSSGNFGRRYFPVRLDELRR